MIIRKILRKYFAALFVLATLMAVFHHHSDLEVHEDCQICSISSNIFDGDIQREPVYLPTLGQTLCFVPVSTLFIYINEIYTPRNPRAPPSYS
ncbi:MULTISPECIES: hypothetical protein [unclassified Sulfurimonas]|uniref:hypothetical protein n=1 Tax=unclassified Sulfurimonas TaxID=2623549 RepID=UPI003204E7D7